MAFVTDQQAKWVAYGMGGLLVLLWLKAQQDGKTMARVAGEAAADAAIEVVKGAGSTLYDAAADAGSYVVKAYLTEQEQHFLDQVYLYGAALPQSPVEQGIALSFMPTQWTKAALWVGDSWQIMKARMAGQAVHEYRQATGIESKPESLLSKIGF